jgi:hypothetical protein
VICRVGSGTTIATSRERAYLELAQGHGSMWIKGEGAQAKRDLAWRRSARSTFHMLHLARTFAAAFTTDLSVTNREPLPTKPGETIRSWFPTAS